MISSVWQDFLQSLNSGGAQNKFLYSILGALTPVEMTEDTIVVACSNPGMQLFLQKRISEVEFYLQIHFKKKMKLQVVVASPKPQKEVPLFDAFKPTVEDAFARAGIAKKHSFANFAVAGSNQVAYAAAQAVGDNPGHAYNPLFLYGGVGVGKTHLAQAVARRLLEANGERRVLFSPSDQFVNGLIEAIRERATPRFRRRYRHLDLLILDDVQFIAGKASVQEEFFHTFNTIVAQGGQIILTSDKPPGDIKNLEDRLRSRFLGGMIVDIQEPDFELRCAILLIKAQERAIDIEIEATQRIAQEVADSRGLEGTLLSIGAYAETHGESGKITVDIVTAYFSGRTATSMKKITPADIIKTVCSFYDIRPSHLKGSERTQHLALPRQVAMFLLRRELRLKYEEIAYLLKKKDHTTIMHGVEKITARLAKDMLFKGEIDRIIQSLEV